MTVALVTGGARGIGLAISRRLLQDGLAVGILGTRDEPTATLEELRQIAGDPEMVRYFQGSVADLSVHRAFIADVISAWGRLDVLVNNAGIGPKQRNDLLAATPESFDEVLGVNLRGPYFLTQAFANAVIGLRDPSSPSPLATVVNISSISAGVVSTNRGEYCISKAGVSMATQLWAVRLASEGFVVYEVRPGVIATDMTAGVKARYDALIERGMAPINRWGQASDVAAAVAMLVAGNTPYSTGEVFCVDGGMHIPVL